MVKVLDFQPRAHAFRTTGRLQGCLNLSRSFKQLPETFRDFVVKIKLSPRNSSVALRQLSRIHRKGPRVGVQNHGVVPRLSQPFWGLSG